MLAPTAWGDNYHTARQN